MQDATLWSESEWEDEGLEDEELDIESKKDEKGIQSYRKHLKPCFQSFS